MNNIDIKTEINQIKIEDDITDEKVSGPIFEYF
jgi:hypothetical protein